MDLVTPMAPEEIFPLEVWGLILDHLRSPSDLINCIKVCKAWKKLLELKKTTFLMPRVFPILYKYMETVEEDEEDDEEDDENENEDEKEETMTTILKMRLVSHGWKETIDNYHQNYPELNHFTGFQAMTEDPYDESVDVYPPLPLLPYNFNGTWKSKSLAQLERFLGKGFPRESNPFITRHVKYRDNGDKRHQLRFRTAFENMLEAFGSPIWTCELDLRTPTKTTNLYKLVGSYLRLMPNLRSLEVSGYWHYCKSQLKNKSEKEELELLFQNEPLPRLKHLTRLGIRNIPYALSVGILTNNGHVHKLAFRMSHEYNDEVPDYLANVQLPNLKQLAFPYFKNAIIKFPKVNWPIKVLHIRVELANLKNVFQVVSSTFSNTLEHFVLIVHWNMMKIMENLEVLQQIRLELPKLKIFMFEINTELKTIDFLQGCTFLQDIQLGFFEVPRNDEEDDEVSSSSSSTNEDKEDNSVIKFKDCISSMEQSNIWRIFSNLQSIKLKWNEYRIEGEAVTMYPDKIRRFTRRQFEKFSNANCSRHKVPE